jgi:uncharacterized membrane protein YuzA (DUF378 family)
MGFLEWLQDTRVAHFVAEGLWGYPTLETMHTVGMALLIGSLGLINLRVLGFKADLPLLETRKLLPLAWLGFTLNAISGTLLFVSDAVMFAQSYTFRLKIILIILGGINAGLIGSRVFDNAPAGVPATPTRGTKWIAGTSLVFWFGAIICGRLIAYTP